MHKPKSVLVNETNKILWDFEMQTYYLTPAKWPDLVIINKKKKKKKLLSYEFWRFSKPQKENEWKQKERQILITCKRTKKM